MTHPTLKLRRRLRTSFICTAVSAWLVLLPVRVADAQSSVTVPGAVPMIGAEGGVARGAGTILRRATGAAVAAGAVVGINRAFRRGQAGRADIGPVAVLAVQNYGTPLGQEAISDLLSLLEAHPFVGPSAAIDAIARSVASSSPLEADARRVIQDIGLEVATYEARLSELADRGVPNTSAEMVARANEEADGLCENEDAEGPSPRVLPGVAHGGQELPYVTQGVRWWFGTSGNLALIPRQVAERLRGRPFPNFDALRNSIWREIGSDANLAYGFSPRAQTRMRNGLAPIVTADQQVGGQRTYHIHHRIPIARGGPVYSFDNLVIVTPLCHKSLLDDRYHRGG